MRHAPSRDPHANLHAIHAPNVFTCTQPSRTSRIHPRQHPKPADPARTTPLNHAGLREHTPKTCTRVNPSRTLTQPTIWLNHASRKAHAPHAPNRSTPFRGERAAPEQNTPARTGARSRPNPTKTVGIQLFQAAFQRLHGIDAGSAGLFDSRTVRFIYREAERVLAYVAGRPADRASRAALFGLTGDVNFAAARSALSIPRYARNVFNSVGRLRLGRRCTGWV